MKTIEKNKYNLFWSKIFDQAEAERRSQILVIDIDLEKNTVSIDDTDLCSLRRLLGKQASNIQNCIAIHKLKITPDSVGILTRFYSKSQNVSFDTLFFNVNKYRLIEFLTSQVISLENFT